MLRGAWGVRCGATRTGELRSGTSGDSPPDSKRHERRLPTGFRWPDPGPRASPRSGPRWAQPQRGGVPRGGQASSVPGIQRAFRLEVHPRSGSCQNCRNESERTSSTSTGRHWDGARDPAGWKHLRRVLRLWSWMVIAASQPGHYEAREQALAGTDEGASRERERVGRRTTSPH